MRIVDSPNHDERPPGAEITLVVLHSISLPPGAYGGDAIERLFFLVRRDGSVVQFVPVERRAWHAGASAWRGRERCNDFSIGIELEGSEEQPFEDAQYGAVAALIKSLQKKLPLRDVAAHSEVAPGRKTDPGALFDWPRLLAALAAA
jgi:AmpD protein